MTIGRKLEWLLLALTAGLLISLKQLHYGVTHYNIFLVILLLWPLILIISFKRLNRKNKQTNVDR